MGKLRRTVIAAFILLVVALAVLIYVLPGVTGMLVETYPAEYGELEIYDDTVGYFLRNEIVYASGKGGSVNRLAQEGDLLRPFTTVVEVTGDSSSDDSSSGIIVSSEKGEIISGDRATEIRNKVNARMKKTSDYKIESGGIVSFFLDGYEYTLVPDREESIKKDDLKDVSQKQVMETGKTVRSDYPLFKVISNNGWQIISYIPESHMDQYEEGQTVDVTFFETDESKDFDNPDFSERDPLFNKVEMFVKSIEKEGDVGKLVLKSSRYFGGIGQYRVASCRIVSQDVSGLMIENESVTEEDGVTGVYVKNKKGKYDFIPVLVYGNNEKYTVVADTYFYDSQGEYTRTVDPFDDVLRKPRTNDKDEEDQEQGD